MGNIWTIAKKEYKHYFISPIAYAVAFIFLLLVGYLFERDLTIAILSNPFQPTAPSVQMILGRLIAPLLLGMPFITMRLLAEEQRLGTMELLLTAPIRDWELVIGKWLGGFLFLFSLITVTWIYPIILNVLVEPGIDQGILLTGYLGLILLSSAIVAIGVAISSFFEKQIVAAFITYGVILLLWFVRVPAQSAEGLGVTILNNINIISHYINFYRGVIDLSDTVYYLSVTAFGIFLGTMSVEMRRWR